MNTKLPQPAPITLLQKMLQIRYFEEALIKSEKGEERKYSLRPGRDAIAVGTLGAINLRRDYIVTTDTHHALALTYGIPPYELATSLLAKTPEPHKRAIHSSHFICSKRHLLCVDNEREDQIPIATGIALKLKYDTRNGVVLCVFNHDTIQGNVFHESLNLAGLWDLPILYVCEMDNTAADKTEKQNLIAAVEKHGISTTDAPDSEIPTIHRIISDAVEKARTDLRPSLLTLPRWRSELNAATTTPDPVHTLRDSLFAENALSTQEYDDLKTDIRKTMEAAVKNAYRLPLKKEIQPSSLDDIMACPLERAR